MRPIDTEAHETTKTTLARWEPETGQDTLPVMHGEPPADATETIHPLQLVRRRWRLMLTVWLATLIPAVAVIWTQFKSEYEAVGVIRVAPYVPRILFRDEDSGLLPLYGAFLTTQMNLITNPTVLKRTLENPAVQEVPWIASSPDPMTALVDRLIIENPRNTELITITMRGREKQQLAPVVNAILKAYMELVVEEDQQGDMAKLTLLYQKQADLEKELKKRHDELYALANEFGTVSLDSRQSSALETLEQINMQLNKARADRLAAEARIQALRAQAQNIRAAGEPEGLVMESLKWDPEFKALIAARVRAEQELMDISRMSGPNHRSYRVAQSRLDELNRLIANRQQAIARSVHTTVRERTVDVFNQKIAEAQLQLAEATQTEQALQKVIVAEMAKITGMGRKAVQLEALREKAEQTKTLYDAVLQRIQHLEVEKQRPARISVASHAQEPKIPAVDKRPKLTKLSIAGTFVLALMAGVFVERRDTSVHSERDVRRYVGLPVLGARSLCAQDSAARPLEASRVLEEIRTIRSNVLFAEGTGHCRSLLVTSPNPQEGKTRLAADLAAALAQSGRSVLLVDADNRKRTLSRQLNREETAGLAELLTDEIDLDLLTHVLAPEGLSFLPAGCQQDAFGELLVRPGLLSWAVGQFRAFDHVIVDTPPVLLSNESGIWARHLDAIVMVLRAGRSTREDAMDAKERLCHMGGRIIGVVLNGIDPHETYYRWRTYSHNHYEQEQYVHTKT